MDGMVAPVHGLMLQATDKKEKFDAGRDDEDGRWLITHQSRSILQDEGNKRLLNFVCVCLLDLLLLRATARISF
jgi:hypothetical protein